MGHSLGELTALCVTGALSFPEAVRLVVGAQTNITQLHIRLHVCLHSPRLPCETIQPTDQRCIRFYDMSFLVPPWCRNADRCSTWHDIDGSPDAMLAIVRSAAV